MKSEKYHPDQILVYLASPYTHDSPMIVARRYEEIKQITAEVLLQVPGIVPFSPICYTHQFGHLNVDWLARVDYRMLDASDACIIVKQQGYECSHGVTSEKEYCADHGIPLYFAVPKEVVSVCETLWELPF